MFVCSTPMFGIQTNRLSQAMTSCWILSLSARVCVLLLLKSWVMCRKCKILSAYVDCSAGK